jgi:hypothetical protein
LRISPAIRYTRWLADPAAPARTTRPDQLELLVGLGKAFSSTNHSETRRLALGFALGATLTDDFGTFSYQTVTVQPGASFQGMGTDTAGPRSFVPGAALDIRITAALSLEANALYRRWHKFSTNRLLDGTLSRSGTQTLQTWEFPVLAKYRFSLTRVIPFLEAGPAFRTRHDLGPVTRTGIAAGAGIEVRSRIVKVAPAIRYTHWADDTLPLLNGPKHDELQFLTVISR